MITVKTVQKSEMIDITDRVAEKVREAGMRAGLVMLFVPHTTAGITINEGADPHVASDILEALEKMVPQDAAYRHGEGNSPAHVKSSLLGASAMIGISQGKLALGTWQSVFLCEFDGPRTRTVLLHLLPSEE
jgi:secondary thiamine-phosphate synthase enzyme